MTHDASENSAWQQALRLMQPAFIRVIDRLRTTLEQSDWVGQYETVQDWPTDTAPQTQAEVLYLMDRLELVDEDQRSEIEHQLEALPQPVPVYLLHLTKAERARTLNLWELCYQICLSDYSPQIERTVFVELPLEEVFPDYTLFDETGEVDWARLDLKTAQVVESAFQSFERAE
jgi:hypothetical protein